MILLTNRKAILFAFLILMSGSLAAQSAEAPKVKNGIIDLRDWNLSRYPVALSGHWDFYDSELIAHPHIRPRQVYFPEVFDTQGYPDSQFGTYAVRILLPPGNEKLALEIPQLYSSYSLYINGEAVAGNGKPGTSKETTTPQWDPQVVSFEHAQDTLTVVLQIANFYHHHSGAKQPIYLGHAALLEKQYQTASTSNLAECVVLFILGLSFFVIYYVRQEKKKITLYFALLCLSWAIRSVFSNNYLITDYFPDFDWNWMVRIEYSMLYSMLIWAVLFFSRLFPKESSRIIMYILVGVNCLFIVETLVTSPAFFTQWIYLYLIVAALLLIHSAVITIRALLHERAGVWYLVFSLALGLMLFTYDIAVFEGYFQHYDALLFSIGYIVIFILMGIALFYHLKIFKGDGTAGTLTFDDLYGKESVR